LLLSFASKESPAQTDARRRPSKPGFGIDFWHTVEFSKIERTPISIDHSWPRESGLVSSDGCPSHDNRGSNLPSVMFNSGPSAWRRIPQCLRFPFSQPDKNTWTGWAGQGGVPFVVSWLPDRSSRTLPTCRLPRRSTHHLLCINASDPATAESSATR